MRAIALLIVQMGGEGISVQIAHDIRTKKFFIRTVFVEYLYKKFFYLYKLHSIRLLHK